MFCVFSIRNFNLCNLKGNGNIANDFAGSVYPQRYLTKLTSDRLLRPHNGLMIYNQIERALVITKWKLTYCNSNFLLVMISKVEKNWSKTYIYKQTNHQLQRFHAILPFGSTAMELNAQDCGISKAAKDTSMLPSKIDHIKASQETVSEANIGLGRALCLPTLECILRRQHF